MVAGGVQEKPYTVEPLDKPNLNLPMLVSGWSFVLESLDRTIVVLNC